MTLTDRFNNWPPAVRLHDAITGSFPSLMDGLLAKIDRPLTFLCNVGMRTALNIKPLGWNEAQYDLDQLDGKTGPWHLDSYSKGFALLGAGLFVGAFAINLLP